MTSEPAKDIVALDRAIATLESATATLEASFGGENPPQPGNFRQRQLIVIRASLANARAQKARICKNL